MLELVWMEQYIYKMILKELHDKYKAGKGDFLIEAYERIFKDAIRYTSGNLLELGIWKGGSLRMWRDYFKQFNILGLDRNPKWMIKGEERIQTLVANQIDIPDLFADKLTKFDIIIDDMSHVGSLTKQSFRHLFDNNLKPGGIYVIEDWQTGYRDKKIINGEMFDYEGKAYDGTNHTAGMVGFIKELIDELSLAQITDSRYGNGQPPQQSTIREIRVFMGVVFIWKK